MSKSVVIEMEHFSVVFDKFIIPPMSLSFETGEQVVIIGPNGAGKTTMLNSLATRFMEYSGMIRFRGSDIRRHIPKIRNNIGLMPERLLGFPWMTVSQHLSFLSNFYPAWDSEYVYSLVARLEIPLNTQLGKLSKGTRAKTAFVAVEAYQPELLILDEPTTGLDPIARKEILSIIQEATSRDGRRTLLLSTHILEDLDYIGDRIIIMNNGMILADERADRLSRLSQGASLSAVILNLLEKEERTKH